MGFSRLRSVLDVTATVLVIAAAAAVLTLTVRNWRQASAQGPRQPSAPTLPKAPPPQAVRAKTERRK